MSLKERSERKVGPIAAFLTAITLIGVSGLGIMLGGALSLTTEAHLDPALIGFFMLFTFLIVAITEILLVRQLSRFTSVNQVRVIEAPQHQGTTSELRPSGQRSLAEPLPSVTENTTRTLEYSRHEPLK